MNGTIGHVDGRLSGRRFRRATSGFSIVEVLAVVAIIAGLVALLLPAVQSARESSRRVRCLNNLRQIGIGFHNHESARGFFPTSVTGNGARYYWVAQTLPYIDDNPLAGIYDYAVAYNDAKNRDAVQVTVDILCCPSAPAGPRQDAKFRTGSPSWGAAVTDYAGSSGPSNTLWNAPATVSYAKPGSTDGFFKVAIAPGEKGRRIRDVTDGTSKSIAIVECAGRPQVWAFGRMSPDSGLASSPTTKYVSRCAWADGNQFAIKGFQQDSSQPDPANQCKSPGPLLVNSSNNAGIYGMHSGVAGILFVDGSARFLEDSASADVVASQLTIEAADAIWNP